MLVIMILNALPEPLKNYVRLQIERGAYGSEQDVIEAALRGQLDRDRQIDELLEESFNCGPPVEFTPELLEGILQRVVNKQAPHPTS